MLPLKIDSKVIKHPMNISLICIKTTRMLFNFPDMNENFPYINMCIDKVKSRFGTILHTKYDIQINSRKELRLFYVYNCC